MLFLSMAPPPHSPAKPPGSHHWFAWLASARSPHPTPPAASCLILAWDGRLRVPSASLPSANMLRVSVSWSPTCVCSGLAGAPLIDRRARGEGGAHHPHSSRASSTSGCGWAYSQASHLQPLNTCRMPSRTQNWVFNVQCKATLATSPNSGYSKPRPFSTTVPRSHRALPV